MQVINLIKKLLNKYFKYVPILALKHDHSPNNSDIIALNTKVIAYEIADQLAKKNKRNSPKDPPSTKLMSQACKQDDIDSDWCNYWANELKVDVVYHRKLWELTYVLHALYQNDMLKPGLRGICFGCGVESIPCYLASKHIYILATDIAKENPNSVAWSETGQHSSSVDDLYFKNVCSRADFDKFLSWQDADMNNIPSDLQNFDFCWSICALEHLGSIEKSLCFIENSLSVLKPGGVAIHTTEYAYLSDDKLPTEGPIVLFNRNIFYELANKLEKKGHYIEPYNFDTGDKFMDKFIDFPPFSFNAHDHIYKIISNSSHLKVFSEGNGTTCFGLIIRKNIYP